MSMAFQKSTYRLRRPSAPPVSRQLLPAMKMQACTGSATKEPGNARLMQCGHWMSKYCWPNVQSLQLLTSNREQIFLLLVTAHYEQEVSPSLGVGCLLRWLRQPGRSSQCGVPGA